MVDEKKKFYLFIKEYNMEMYNISFSLCQENKIFFIIFGYEQLDKIQDNYNIKKIIYYFFENKV